MIINCSSKFIRMNDIEYKQRLENITEDIYY